MASSRSIVLRGGYRYRGKTGMLNWALHRITGLGIVLFVGLHVIAAFGLQQFGNDLATTVTTFYESWQFQIIVYFCVLFHAINGVRVALVDLFPSLMRFQKELYWLQWIVFVPAYLLPVFVLIQNGLRGS
jgi:succinate dehydrogenase / fumarate reductase cytochrome b subunit